MSVARITIEHMFESAIRPAPRRSRSDQAELLHRARALGVGVEALTLLDSIDPAQLDAHDRVDFLSAWVAHDGWLSMRRAAATVAVAGPEPLPSARTAGDPRVVDEESVIAEVAVALRVSEVTASAAISTARALAGPLAPVREVMESGLWSFGHLRAAECELVDVPAETCQRVLEVVLAHAATDTPARLRYRIRRAVARFDATAVAQRIESAATRRRAELRSLPDLQGELRITGSWALTSFCHQVADTWAHREFRRLTGVSGQGADGVDCDLVGVPTMSALRADAYVAAMSLLARTLNNPNDAREVESLSGMSAMSAGSVEGVAGDVGAVVAVTPGGDGRSRRRSWSEAIVMIPVGTALAMSDEPGHVPGYGPVPATVARELLATADTWRRFLTDDDTGKLVDVGRARYRPSQRLREYVTARDQLCVFPGCGRASSELDIDLDHRANFDGANTGPENLQPLCRRHHRLKTHGQWAVSPTADPPVWTSPSRHRYPAVPPPLWEAPARAPARRSAA